MWLVTLEMEGFEPLTRTGEIQMSDKFKEIIGDGKAKVEILTGTQQGFGALKCHAVVTVTCGQAEATIDKAGEFAFFKAKELMEDGMSELIDAQSKAHTG